MICPQCNNEIKEGAKFCTRCGALIPKPKRCSKCETPLDSATRFCPVCGSPNLYYNPSEDKTNKPDNPVNKDEPVISHIKEEPFAPLNSGAMDIPAASPIEPTRPSAVPPVVPPPAMVNPPEQNNNNLKIWVFVSAGIAVIAVVILLYTLFGDTVIEKSRSRSALADESNYDTAVVDNPGDNDYLYGSNMEESPKPSDYYAEPDRGNERMHGSGYSEEQVRKVAVPDATYVSSSEAYDIYPGYITDYKTGEEWRDSEIVRSVFRKGGDYYFMSATGYIEDKPIDFQAVIAPDNRIYGRYHNSNGTKLDLNGVQDASGNLIIKLAHGEYTSYWILSPDGTPRQSGSGTYYYIGTWGHKEKESSIEVQYYR